MMTERHPRNIHPELDHFVVPGGLFDVEPCALDLNVGKRCRFIAPKCAAETDGFTIVAVQKNYRGDICYRVVGDQDAARFGRVAHPEDIDLI